MTGHKIRFSGWSVGKAKIGPGGWPGPAVPSTCAIRPGDVSLPALVEDHQVLVGGMIDGAR
ncbi:hypothetical protein NCC78_00485 [Micromonospora phytophila]|uniref:hypothetical protein n=1 Tax=Micromonospora phytophila TaxID=709888 RepID=UPI00203018F0|nr:hypothetical protein [Micromonospora phytophila]MCM0673212.1 hypothetical protein [Micromonospora phytophila]